MKKSALFILIGLISGTVLALFLKITQLIWGIRAYDLLFEVSYIPVLKDLYPVWLIQGIFHFATCIASLWILYYLLTYLKKETDLWAYLLVVGIGSALLYFLTIFANNTPEITNESAWILWVIGHALFSLTGWYLIKRWIGRRIK